MKALWACGGVVVAWGGGESVGRVRRPDDPKRARHRDSKSLQPSFPASVHHLFWLLAECVHISEQSRFA